VVLRLTPFSFNTLDHFIYLERPTGVEARDGEGFQVLEHSRDQAYLGLMPSSQEYVTVSHLYEAIRANLIAFANVWVKTRSSRGLNIARLALT
jgi:hypothetical protein